MQHTLTFKWESGSRQVTSVVTATSEAEVNATVEIPAETADKEIDLALAVASLALLYIVSDKAATVKTNNTSTPDDTLELVAGVPVAWVPDGGMACPLTVDVTKLYVSNAGAEAATLEIRALLDVTP